MLPTLARAPRICKIPAMRGPTSETDLREPLTRATWLDAAARHRERVEQWTVPIRARLARGEKHPVFDFLHTYYHTSLGKLESWHPGFGVRLEDCREARRAFSEKHYRFAGGVCEADPGRLGARERERLQFMRGLLTATQARPPNFACHGLHEWAMVYRGAMVRHQDSAPLRLSQDDIDALVESHPLCCTHFDAFRFFTPEAKPRNRLQPDLWSREDHEQPGCLHANMDLYKWSAKALPWTPSELVAESFALALRAREVDMRASPYDLSKFGYEAIAIEKPEGRDAYEQAQRILCAEARPLRARLIASLDNLLAAAPGQQ